MKYLSILAVFILCSFGLKQDQQENPWKDSQLMAPEVLAKKITDNNLKNTVILAIGFEAVIKNSVDMGPASTPEGMAHLESYLKNVKKNKEVVLYCGCCPFTKCPNVRPAFKKVQALGYKNVKLLNLTTNIKTDWLDHNYPTLD